MRDEQRHALVPSLRSTEAGTLAAETFLKRLSPELPHLLSDIRDSPPWLEEVAGSSYRHVLGFTKLVLLSEYPAWQLRLHYWDSPSLTTEDFHDHRFDFSSCVVHGSITNDLYRETDDPAASIVRPELFDAAPLQSRAWRPLLRRDRVRLIRVRTTTYGPGAAYSMRSVDIHTSRLNEPRTVTLLLEGRHAASGSHIYPAGDRHHEQTTPQTPLTSLECLDVFENVLDVVKCQTPNPPRLGTDV